MTAWLDRHRTILASVTDQINGAVPSLGQIEGRDDGGADW
jgi:hypothetical protein